MSWPVQISLSCEDEELQSLLVLLPPLPPAGQPHPAADQPLLSRESRVQTQHKVTHKEESSVWLYTNGKIGSRDIVTSWQWGCISSLWNTEVLVCWLQGRFHWASLVCWECAISFDLLLVWSAQSGNKGMILLLTVNRETLYILMVLKPKLSFSLKTTAATVRS